MNFNGASALTTEQNFEELKEITDLDGRVPRVKPTKFMANIGKKVVQPLSPRDSFLLQASYRSSNFSSRLWDELKVTDSEQLVAIESRSSSSSGNPLEVVSISVQRTDRANV